jgi:hypothetical protein
MKVELDHQDLLSLICGSVPTKSVEKFLEIGRVLLYQSQRYESGLDSSFLIKQNGTVWNWNMPELDKKNDEDLYKIYLSIKESNK